MIIYKYRLEIKDRQLIKMKECAVIMHVGLDVEDHLCVWAEVNSNFRDVQREFFVRGTGQERDDVTGGYLGTVRMDPYMWHVYEGKEIYAN